MEWIRWQQSPWGQDVILGLAWGVAWLALGLGLAFALGHALVYLWRLRGAKPPPDPARQALLATLPARILRHSLASRGFHWVMAASVLTLLGTAYLPLLGLKFPWVTPHWIAGFVLTVAIGFHVVHTTFFKGLRLMWVDRDDLRAGLAALRAIVAPGTAEPPRGGKNPVENKLFHHAVAVAGLTAIATGLAMMAKVDTPWWNRNPYLLADGTWGVIYLLHGLGSVGLIALVVVHVYFALRPEKAWITWSMLRGWIPRERYLERHDPQRWPPVAADGAATQHGAAAAPGGTP